MAQSPVEERPQTAEAAPAPLLEIDALDIALTAGRAEVPIVRQASLKMMPGEIHALVGESGSGKTMLARSLIGLLPDGIEVTAGRIRFDGTVLTDLDESGLRARRGVDIGMIFQEPLVSLNPSMKIGAQMAEAMRLHTGAPASEIRKRSIEMLEAVRIKDPEGCLDRYPHEFSGGMRQRIMIASVMLLRPKLLLADEPTTALDAVVQQDVLDIMTETAERFGASVLLVTHDLGLVARYANTLSVMEKGRIVEAGKTADVLAAPADPYTQRLLAALPKRPDEIRPSAEGEPLIKAEKVSISYEGAAKFFLGPRREVPVVHEISLDIRPGEMLGLVGESGSGKSTLGRALIRLKDTSGGRIAFRGADITQADGSALRDLRSKMQIVFQDPYSSLNPRYRISRIVGEPLRLHKAEASTKSGRMAVDEMLEAVGLDASYGERFPHELSGGQRQRVAIARALISNPDLVVADEPVSALDVTVQAQILALLADLRARLGFACLFISHDLSVVESLCDRIMVMYRGRTMEQADAETLFRDPRHPYTRRLLEASHRLERQESGAYGLREGRYADTAEATGTFYWPEGDKDDPDYRLAEVARDHFVALHSAA
ncbi:ABC transporter ATP-binding protein [Pseudooceanicola nanhaiensis]|uniref:ABC transporter ATP-binding protein n=1 Tax=Pseudooceanicola nanhaiensis TaxID=375761 RepID=UPI001CD3200D|nr:ABC transporter ATP-binding protein [Pseudooceanicola nanhaiensis]MCA0921420.1 ABC transporter ATP-binding protein [Pseudooceanicola nanhaiensis]